MEVNAKIWCVCQCPVPYVCMLFLSMTAKLAARRARIRYAVNACSSVLYHFTTLLTLDQGTSAKLNHAKSLKALDFMNPASHT